MVVGVLVVELALADHPRRLSVERQRHPRAFVLMLRDVLAVGALNCVHIRYRAPRADHGRVRAQCGL